MSEHCYATTVRAIDKNYIKYLPTPKTFHSIPTTQAIDHGCMFVQGATMLLEQAVEQFELWHRRRAPREVMSKAVFEEVEQLHF